MSEPTAPAESASQSQMLAADANINRDPVVQQDAAAQNAPTGILTDEQIAEFDLTELKLELRQRDLPTSGNKPELAERLREHEAAQREGKTGPIAKGQVTGGAVTGGNEAVKAAETGGQLTGNGTETTEDVQAELDEAEAVVHGQAVSAPFSVEHGGITRTAAGAEHTDLLQQLSDDRRKAQLAAANRY